MAEPRNPFSTVLPILLVVAGVLFAAWLAWRLETVVQVQDALERKVAEQRAEIARLDDVLSSRPEMPPLPAAPEEADGTDEEPAPAAGAVYEFGVLQMVLDAIGRQDAARQRALTTYLDGLSDPVLRERMLALLRDEATDRLASKQAGALLGRAVEAASAQVDEQAGGLTFGTLDTGRADGWDYDLFVCRSTIDAADPALGSEIERLLDSLRTADPRHGHIRLSPLEPDVRQSDDTLVAPGLFLLVDQGRGDEVRQAASLARRLAFDGYDFAVRGAIGAPSPWYISLFYCPD